jgi:ATPase family associated with various cellular activities (AAA)
MAPEHGYEDPPYAPMTARTLAASMLTDGLREHAMNWLWWAASGGDDQAAILFISNLEILTQADEVPAQQAVVILSAWARHKTLSRQRRPDPPMTPAPQRRNPHLPPQDPPMKSKASSAFKRDDNSESLNVSSLIGLDDEEETAPEPQDGVIVVSRVGDANSNVGADISRRVSHILARKLPFSGQMPHAAVFAQEFKQKFPWASGLARYLQGQLAQAQINGSRRLVVRPLLLVGPPGCGKTTMAEWITRRLGLYSVTIPVGGTSDSAGLVAVSRSWATAQPSAPLGAFMEGCVANPALILDEIDKTTPEAGARNGSVSAALLSLMSPSDGGYRDAWLQANIDVSYISWLATANSLSAIPAHLQDRFIIQPVPAPKEEHFDVILSGVSERYASKMQIDQRFLPFLSKTDISWLKKAFLDGGSIRSLDTAFSLLSGERAIHEAEMQQVLN